MNFLRIVFAICIFLGAISCSSSKVSYHYPNGQDVKRKSKSGRFMSASWLPFSGKTVDKKEEKKAAESNDLNLWQSSVQVVGLMFPISIIDEKSGIIATQWHQESPESNTRIKINILIREAKSLDKSIRVSVFQQNRKDEDSSWQGSGLHSPKSVAKSAMKAQKLKAEILRRVKLENKE